MTKKILKIISYSIYGLKANNQYLQELVSSNDLAFIFEHWLVHEQEYNVHKFAGETHQLIFMSHFNLADKKFFEKNRYRPHGGVFGRFQTS